MTDSQREIAVVGAVIERDGLILCARKGGDGPLAGLWEFPGGKIEPGEDPRDALVREIDEELGCRVAVGPRVTETRHPYPFAVIVLTTFRCVLTAGVPRATEHDEVRWLAADELATLDWAPADLPAVAVVSGVARTGRSAGDRE